MTLSLTKLDDLIDALLANASGLVDESSLLIQHGHLARGHALAHLAREELSKSVMLESAAIRVLAGAPVDWKQLMKRFRGHDDKLKLEGVRNALAMSSVGQTKEALVVLQAAAQLAKHRNERKNAALYVELHQGKISKPSEQFSESQATRTFKLAQLWFLEQKTLRDKLGRYDRRDREKYKGMSVPSQEEIVGSDPEALLTALGRAQAAIWEKVLKPGEGA